VWAGGGRLGAGGWAGFGAPGGGRTVVTVPSALPMTSRSWASHSASAVTAAAPPPPPPPPPPPLSPPAPTQIVYTIVDGAAPAPQS
jgi:hypothetical protein